MITLTEGYSGVEAARDACITLLHAARAAGIPVPHTNVQYQPGGRDGGVFIRKVPALRGLEAGAHPELAAFDPALLPVPGETVITKQYAICGSGRTGIGARVPRVADHRAVRGARPDRQTRRLVMGTRPPTGLNSAVRVGPMPGIATGGRMPRYDISSLRGR